MKKAKNQDSDIVEEILAVCPDCGKEFSVCFLGSGWVVYIDTSRVKLVTGEKLSEERY